MDHPTIRTTIATVTLTLSVVACGAATPSSGAPVAAGSNPSSPAKAAAAPSAAPSPTAAPSPAPIVVVAAPLEPALKELWRIGGPKPSELGGCCIAVAPDGKIWVSAMFDSMFWIFDREGNYLESWGTPGAGDGQFDFVVSSDGVGGVAFDPDGTFYVVDSGNRRIQKFDKDRQFVTAWGSFGTENGQFAKPADIASDGHGHVYVVDWGRLDVQQFSSTGQYIRTFVADLQDNYFIETDAKDRLYVNAGPTILVFEANGDQLSGIDLSSTGAWAAGMAFDADGHLYVATVSNYEPSATPGPIYELDASGSVLHAWPGNADSIALDPKAAALYTSFFTEPFIRKLELPKP